MGYTWFGKVWMVFTRLDKVCMGFTIFGKVAWILIGLAGFKWVAPCLYWLGWVFTRFVKVWMGFYQVW